MFGPAWCHLRPEREVQGPQMTLQGSKYTVFPQKLILLSVLSKTNNIQITKTFNKVNIE